MSWCSCSWFRRPSASPRWRAGNSARRMKRYAAAAGCALALMSHLAGAQPAYPAKTVRFIVPFAPGGGTDAFARTLSAKLVPVWGQQIVVENRAGAQGNIGTAAGAKAAPDGYTLTLGYVGTLAINPHLYKDAGFDPLKEFA